MRRSDDLRACVHVCIRVCGQAGGEPGQGGVLPAVGELAGRRGAGGRVAQLCLSPLLGLHRAGQGRGVQPSWSPTSGSSGKGEGQGGERGGGVEFGRKGGRKEESREEGRNCCCLLGAGRPSSMPEYLRSGSAQTRVRAATLK